MIRANVYGFRGIRTLASVGLFAIGLVVITADPGLAQTSGTWTTTGSLNTPRGGHRATLLQNGEVLVTGGEAAGSNILTGAELYNPATGKWTVTGSMATPRVAHPSHLRAILR